MKLSVDSYNAASVLNGWTVGMSFSSTLQGLVLSVAIFRKHFVVTVIV